MSITNFLTLRDSAIEVGARELHTRIVNVIGCSTFLEAFSYACGWSFRQILAKWGAQFNAAISQVENGTYNGPTAYQFIEGIIPNPRRLPFVHPVPVEQAPVWSDRPVFLGTAEMFMQQYNRLRSNQGPEGELEDNVAVQAAADLPPPPYTETSDPPVPGPGIPSTPTTPTFVTAPSTPLQRPIPIPPTRHLGPVDGSSAIVPGGRRVGGGAIHLVTPFTQTMNDYLTVHQYPLIADHTRRQLLGDIFFEYVNNPPVPEEIRRVAVIIAQRMSDSGLNFGFDEEARFFARWVLRYLSSQSNGKLSPPEFLTLLAADSRFDLLSESRNIGRAAEDYFPFDENLVDYLMTHQAELHRNQPRMQDLRLLIIHHVETPRDRRVEITRSQLDIVGLYEHYEGMFFVTWAIEHLLSHVYVEGHMDA